MLENKQHTWYSPCNMAEKDWSEYYKLTKARPPSKLLVAALEYIPRRGNAIDIGAGSLKDTVYLLEQGFHVTAVDKSPLMEEEAKLVKHDNLRAFTSAFEDFNFQNEEYDLASAMFSLPFTNPLEFDTVFANIKKSLKKDGVFCGQFFGVHDEWSTNSKMTFHSKDQVEKLLEDLEIIRFQEEEKDDSTAMGQIKHWHIFHVIAKKK